MAVNVTVFTSTCQNVEGQYTLHLTLTVAYLQNVSTGNELIDRIA